MDIAIIATLVGSFALLVSVHLTLALGLVWRRRYWRGALTLVLPPLAPYWGFGEGMRVRSILWVTALGLYVASLIAAWI
jgi:hypothetical protein